MLVGIHQPEHAPWLGFVSKMHLVDIFILLDNVQFAKNNRQNRTQIVTRQHRPEWVTVPVQAKNRLNSTLAETRIADLRGWRPKYWNKVESAYRSAPYFDKLNDELKPLIFRGQSSLVDLNLSILNWLRTVFAIGTPTILASDINYFGETKSERLCSLVRSVGGTDYLSGSGGRAYLDEGTFRKAKLNLWIMESETVPYPAHNGFRQGVSSIDALASIGPERVDDIQTSTIVRSRL